MSHFKVKSFSALPLGYWNYFEADEGQYETQRCVGIVTWEDEHGTRTASWACNDHSYSGDDFTPASLVSNYLGTGFEDESAPYEVAYEKLKPLEGARVYRGRA